MESVSGTGKQEQTSACSQIARAIVACKRPSEHFRLHEIAIMSAASNYANNNDVKRLRNQMTALSMARYLAWRAAPFGRTLRATLLDGQQLLLRPLPADDLATAYEVFVLEMYCSPRSVLSGRVHRIVDVGANVGYTVGYWGRHYPTAHIEAFEPHPEHLRLLARTVQINNLKERVTIHPFAAGVEAGTGYLVDAGTCSTVINQERERAIPIQVVDFFQAIGTRGIDLLKLDCEGSEYSILMDSRFEKLKVGTLFVEWHATPEHSYAGREIAARLRELGRSLEFGIDGESRYGIRTGIIWAYDESISTEPDYLNSI
jgi:FkbM family methyltransferase